MAAKCAEERGAVVTGAVQIGNYRRRLNPFSNDILLKMSTRSPSEPEKSLQVNDSERWARTGVLKGKE